MKRSRRPSWAPAVSVIVIVAGLAMPVTAAGAASPGETWRTEHETMLRDARIRLGLGEGPLRAFPTHAAVDIGSSTSRPTKRDPRALKALLRPIRASRAALSATPESRVDRPSLRGGDCLCGSAVSREWGSRGARDLRRCMMDVPPPRPDAE